MKERVGAVIIKNKKILLVTIKGASYYWTPGGKVELKESLSQALKRELKEELNLSLVSMKDYISYEIQVEGFPLKVSNFIVQYRGIIKPSSEIDTFGWFSNKDIQESKVKLPEEMKKYLLPKLLRDNKL